MVSAPSNALPAVLAHIRAGGRAMVVTYTKATVIDRKCLERWERAGEWLLREDGNGYRLRTGRKSVYLIPGQLMLV